MQSDDDKDKVDDDDVNDEQPPLLPQLPYVPSSIEFQLAIVTLRKHCTTHRGKASCKHTAHCTVHTFHRTKTLQCALN